MTRTYRREDLVDANRRWSEGEFGVEWQPYQQAAARRGFIFPPDGDRHDSVEDATPSQRAILYRAIEDTPALLRQAIATSRSWHEVVRFLIAQLERMREEAGLDEQAMAVARASNPTRRQAPELIASILGRQR